VYVAVLPRSGGRWWWGEAAATPPTSTDSQFILDTFRDRQGGLS
jgi:hypothetical protein